MDAVGRVLLLLGAAGTAICAVLPWVTVKGPTIAIDLGVIGASVTPGALTVSGSDTRRRRAEATSLTPPDRRLSRARALVGAQILMLVGLLSAGVTAATPAAPARTAPVCRAATILDRLVDGGKLRRREIELGRGVTSVRCRDLTRDGERDALFAIASGGTAGNTNFGILLGRAGGAPGRLALYRNGYKVTIAATAGQPEVLQPIYRREDPNCCPSSFEIRRYRWTGTRFTLRSRYRTKSAPKRFRA